MAPPLTPLSGTPTLTFEHVRGFEYRREYKVNLLKGALLTILPKFAWGKKDISESTHCQ